MKPKILMVDDDTAARFGFSKYLGASGYEVQTASTLSEARDAVDANRFDAILLDLRLPDGNGNDWIPELRAKKPHTAIVVITGNGDVQSAVHAMKNGADNFLTKPVDMQDLDVFLQKSIEVGGLRRKDSIQRRLKKKEKPFFGQSEIVRQTLEHVDLASENDSVVMLQGETGTGKGVLARWIHENSGRSENAFVEVNCSGLKGDLLGSELFGHVKGSFTSAVKDREGLIEVADGGTLFLDEIGDMDIGVQAQLLKAIEEKEFRRIGETRMRKSDFRLICATNKDLAEEVEKGNFRTDLFYRINIFPIHIPSIRERREDIEGMAKNILREFGVDTPEISSEVMEKLESYSWPGNIRELRNMLERALILSRGNQMTTAAFPGLKSSLQAASPEINGDVMDLEELELQHIQKVMKQFGNDTVKASKALGISRASLYRKLKKGKNNSEE